MKAFLNFPLELVKFPMKRHLIYDHSMLRSSELGICEKYVLTSLVCYPRITPQFLEFYICG